MQSCRDPRRIALRTRATGLSLPPRTEPTIHPMPESSPVSHATTHHARARWVRLRSWAVAIGLGLIAAVAVLLALTWWLIRARPDWWVTQDRNPKEAAAVGQEVENAVVSQLHAARDDSVDWAVSLTARDANDWLATRLVKWLVNRDPSIDWRTSIEATLVQFDGGHVLIGASIRTDPGASGHVVWADLEPSVDEEGRLWLRAHGIWLGRLPLPLGSFSGGPDGLAMRAIPGDIENTKAAGSIVAALTGQAPLASEPVATLADGRRVRLLAVRTRDGRLELTCRTEQAK